MIKKIFLLLFFTFGIHFSSLAQEYGNEWINFSQAYYKIPVGKDGMYRITYQGLVDAGIPVASIDPRNIQIFHRGVEQPVLVEGELDAEFNPSDYIIFYGTKNDGTLDKRLYQPNSAQPHPHYNLYSDTTAYFLTWKFSGANGRRMQFFKETNTSGIPKEAGHFPVIRNIYHDQYSPGRTFNEYTQFSQFDVGEGWTGTRIQENETIDYTITGLNNGLTTAGQPAIKIHLQGRDDMQHRAEISVGKDLLNLRNLGSVDFTGYESASFESTLSWTDISSTGTVIVRARAVGPEGNDLLSVSYIEVTVPKEINLQNNSSYTIFLEENAGGKSYIEVPNIIPGTAFYDVTDKEQVKKIGYDLTGSTAEIVVPDTEVNRKLIAVADYITPELKEINFRQFNPNDAQYVIISHPLLMQSAGGYADAVDAYSAYRSSPEGGGFKVLTADILQLYNQFNYGEISPLAIFDFVRYLKDNGSPEFLFFIGEGLEVLYNYHRKPDQYTFRDLVPTAGLPASDIIYSAGMDGITYKPTIPTGRLTASSPRQVINYLEKVKVMESLPYDALWRKNVLHLSGGIRDYELRAFRLYADAFANIAEGPYLGGNVRTIQKNTRSTSEFINISDEINNGVNLVMFFGHSAPSVTDIDIGFVSNPVLGYNNENKYPVFLINGCNAGQFFLNNFLFGEDWVLAPDKGAIGFIAHTSYGFTHSLRRYTTKFYETGYGDEEFIERRLGAIQKEVIERFAELDTLMPDQIAVNQQMFLLGDPATYLFGADAPDYALEENSAFAGSFDGLPVTALSDSFAVNVIVKNFGKAPPDSIKVSLRRTLSDGSLITSDTIFPPVLYADTLQFVVHNEGPTGFGLNNFHVTIDSDNSFDELDESNNSISFDYTILLNATRNLLPYDFAVVNEEIDDIVVQASSLMSSERQFILHLDTVSSFNSPYLKTETITRKLLAKWQADWINEDTVTYFVRSKFNDAVEGEVDEWYSSSFTRITGGEPGWAQRKPHQLAQNSFSGLTFDAITGEFKFLEKVRNVDIRTFGSQNPADASSFSVSIDDEEYNIDNGSRCRDNTVNFIAFDKETAVPYAPIPFIFQDIRTCGRQPQVINSFRQNQLATGNQDDISALVSGIGEGDSIVVFTIGDAQYSLWPEVVKDELEKIGIDRNFWNSVQDGEPLIIRGKKGANAGTATILKANELPAEDQELFGELTFTGIRSSGQLKTSLIGPSQQWKNFSASVDMDEHDEIIFNIEAVDLLGNSVLAYSTAEKVTDISGINAAEFPFIRLSVEINDPVELTPPQLRQWMVNYAPAPEGIILPVVETEIIKKQEGDSLNLVSSFYNLSPWNFNDSLLVEYSIINATSNARVSQESRIAGPASGDTISFDLNFSTLNMVGLNNLEITVNPRVEPELYYENNTLPLNDYLQVKADEASPLLDVRFDGKHIFNRDIVSPNPLISVILKDENVFLTQSDTTGLDIFLKSCETCEFKRIAFSGGKIQSFPDPEKNEYAVEFKPGPLEDGIYTLRVHGKDVSGNTAGEGPYEIQFEVINESTVTNFYPYPNPFSTNVQFIFTLTGNELPDQMLIQIMTISGRVVKEISLEEFGMFRIGNNISDYAWDGRDEFGDQLANGVYLYKVILKRNGREIKQRASAGDDLFKNGYGKLYLLR